MFKKILVPVALDHEEHGRRALKVAKGLRDEGGSIILMHILEEIPTWVMSQLPSGVANQRRDDAASALHGLAEGAGADIEVSVIYGHSGRTIVEQAEELEADCVIVSSHRPGLTDYFLGSTAATVARHAACNVVILR